MYAVVQIGAEQFKVSEGDVIDAAKSDLKEGKDVTLDKVLLFAKGSDVRIGQPFLKDVKVTAGVLGQDKGKKLISYKYRRRKDSATKIGSRKQLTRFNIKKISA